MRRWMGLLLCLLWLTSRLAAEPPMSIAGIRLGMSHEELCRSLGDSLVRVDEELSTCRNGTVVVRVRQGAVVYVAGPSLDDRSDPPGSQAEVQAGFGPPLARWERG
ncbi:MAG: hypothetical protein AB1758_33630, partial [Candidatus Eremiobacterota bacterium]